MYIMYILSLYCAVKHFTISLGIELNCIYLYSYLTYYKVRVPTTEFDSRNFKLKKV